MPIQYLCHSSLHGHTVTPPVILRVQENVFQNRIILLSFTFCQLFCFYLLTVFKFCFLYNNRCKGHCSSMVMSPTVLCVWRITTRENHLCAFAVYELKEWDHSFTKRKLWECLTWSQLIVYQKEVCVKSKDTSLTFLPFMGLRFSFITLGGNWQQQPLQLLKHTLASHSAKLSILMSEESTLPSL